MTIETHDDVVALKRIGRIVSVVPTVLRSS